MTLGAPTVDYERMNLVTMPHGPQGDGIPKAGSLEILTAADDAKDLRAMTSPPRSLKSLDATQVNESEVIQFPLHDLNVVIMNPPFTDHMKRSRKFGSEAVRSMQRHELDIRDRVEQRDEPAGRVIKMNSISTFFTPLAERLLNPRQGTLAKVVPVTGCIGASGVAERRFLAKRFHVERVVTTHDPRRIAFSENTSIHECLLVCRRQSETETNRRPTEFVSLRKMPESAEEMIEATDAIASGCIGEWGQTCSWPADLVRVGDWSPAQWYDSELAEIVRGLETDRELVSAGTVLRMGATRQAAQDSWKRANNGEDTRVRVFDSVSPKVRSTMLDTPEQPVVPGGRRAHLYESVLASKANLMLATRQNTVSGVLTALWSEEATFGFGWLPAKGPDRLYEQALCAWWNSSAGRLLLLNRRSKTLTYPTWSVNHLMTIPCPKPETMGCRALAKAWQETCRTPLLPMRQAEECEVRNAIDDAAALAIGVDVDVLAGWRRRLAAEPTITNMRATRLGVSAIS